MTRQEAFNEINRIQDEYVDELIGLINSSDYSAMGTYHIEKYDLFCCGHLLPVKIHIRNSH